MTALDDSGREVHRRDLSEELIDELTADTAAGTRAESLVTEFLLELRGQYGTPALPEVRAALAELITSGGLDRHIRRNRTRYRRRRDELVAALGTVPAIRVRGIAAGLHAVVDLPDHGPAEADVVASLAAAGVVVHGLGAYWHRPRSRRPGIVVGFGTPAEHAFPAALAALTDALRRAVAGSLP